MKKWSEGNFEIVTKVGKRSITGLVSEPFGIHFDEHRNRPGWIVTHTGTGMSIKGRQPLDSVEMAKEFVARVRPLADRNDIDPEAPPDVAAGVDEIADELNSSDPLADLMRVPPYMGDEAFRAFLGKHGCSTSIEIIRLRFLGVAVSPGGEADVYSLVEDLFDYQMPELNEQELVSFLHAFLGLFQEVEKASVQSSFALSPVGAVESLDGIKDLLVRRLDEVRFGFLEGVWQGDDELPLSGPQAAMLTAVEETARTYQVRLFEIQRNEDAATRRPVTDWLREIAEIDRAIETSTMSLLEALRSDRSTDHPMMKRAENLISELDMPKELPREAIRECVARRDEMAPIFLNILRDNADEPGAIDERGGALFLIIHILGELGEQRAFAPLMDLLDGDPELIEDVLGDSITENLSQVLISVFDGDTERLYGLMNNSDADEYVRFAAFEAWTYHVAIGRIDRAEAEQYLTSAFEKLRPPEEHLAWVAWLEAIAHLGFADLKERVRNTFDLGWVSPVIMRFSDFEKLLDGALRSDDLLAFLAEYRIAPFSDTIEALSSWHCFSEEDIRANDRAERELVAPIHPVHTVTNPVRNVGRNDPCPCGSGKKFKKCCLQ